VVRTYAYYDLIGVMELLKRADVSGRLEEFWRLVDMWVQSRPTAYARCLDGERCQVPRVNMLNFTDSLLLNTTPEVEIEDFFKVAMGLHGMLDRNEFHHYCIINRDEEIPIPDSGNRTEGGRGPALQFGPGIGPAWYNIYLAELWLRGPDCPLRSKLYLLGNVPLPAGYHVLGEASFEGWTGSTVEIRSVEVGG
jgi:hypothetical protein